MKRPKPTQEFRCAERSKRAILLATLRPQECVILSKSKHQPQVAQISYSRWAKDLKNNNKWKTVAAKKKKLRCAEDGSQNQDNKIKEEMLLMISNAMLSVISKTIALIGNIKARRYHLR
jgi:hypothetical protein